MTKAYHIAQWDTLYETANSRKIVTLTYYQKPNKLVGEGIGLTLQEPDNVALLGTWTLLEALASTSARDQRGWLIRNGSPLTAARMAALTRVKIEHFVRALEHFCRPEIGWLLHSEVPKTFRLSGESPTNPPPITPNNPNPENAGRLSGESPTNLQQERRERESEEEEKKREERGALTLASQSLGGPSVEDVEAWAETTEIPVAFALEKFAEAVERLDFKKPGVKQNWKDRFTRFWNADGKKWSKKNPAPAPGVSGGVTLADMRRAQA